MKIPSKDGKPIITNNMKAECIGEFSFTIEDGCHCDGDPLCGYCSGEGIYDREIYVPWTTVKDIYKRMALVASKNK